MLPSRAQVLAGVYETIADKTPAWEADVLLNYADALSNCATSRQEKAAS